MRDGPDLPFPESKFPDTNTVIWRYVSVASLTAMLQTRELPFTRVDQFRDQHEAVISLPTIERVTEQLVQRAQERNLRDFHRQPVSEDTLRDIVLDVQRNHWRKVRKEAYVNCWHASNDESMAMWELYSNKGVAIRSTVRNLLLALGNRIRGACWVTYVDHGSEEVDDVWPFLFKRREYQYDREIRVFLDPEARHDSNGFECFHVQVECDLLALMDEVRLAPGSPDWLFDTVKRLLAGYLEADIPLVRSKADQLPDALATYMK